MTPQSSSVNRGRAHLFALTLAIGLSHGSLSCSDANEPASTNEAGEAGQANTGASGSAHAGGQPADDTGSAGAGGAVNREALAIEGDRRIPYTPTNDLAFVEFFIAHHQMAIDMATEETERGDSAAVIAMAKKMIAAQTAEIKTLETVKEQLSGTVPDMPDDPHSTADMTRIKAASGAELDRAFLLDMIPHHAAALAPAHRALGYLESSTLKAMAESIVTAQATEIGAMHGMLVDMDSAGAGMDAESDGAPRADFGLLGDRRVPLTPADDVEFIDFFVPHHAMAVEMADHEIAHGADPEVIAVARMMRDAQSAEIELMTAKRVDLAGSAEPAPMPADPHAMEEMAEMTSMSGAELDVMFLTEMIVHHASALPTSHRARPHVKDGELADLADAMFEAQAKEIGELRMMLGD